MRKNSGGDLPSNTDLVLGGERGRRKCTILNVTKRCSLVVGKKSRVDEGMGKRAVSIETTL